MSSLLIRTTRLVPVGRPVPTTDPVDVRIGDGRIVEVARGLRAGPGERVLDAVGRWAMPGLWDAHVHPVMWALARSRVDLAGATSAEDVCRRLAAALPARPGDGLVLGYGHRSATWPRQPTVAELDAVTGPRPVALASGDGHNGWLNSAALRLIGEPARCDALVEDAWYAAYRRLESLATQTEDPEAALSAALAAAVAKGVVGIVDFEFGSAFRMWPERLARGDPPLRVRAAAYADALDDVAAAGLRTGDRLVPESDRVTMGPLKVIGDGSLNTLTAWCSQPYADPPDSRGRSNIGVDDLTVLLTRARGLGLDCAIHAIGDQAVADTLAAIEASGQRGRIEHAQLIDAASVPRMVRLGLTASVQPVHCVDDREVIARYWPDRGDRAYAFRTLLDAGIPLALGSDAPVAPLDPWLSIAAAVHRAGDGEPAWHPDQALTVAEALAASTDGQATLGVGSRADLVLLDDDPLADPGDGSGDTQARARYLREVRVAATVVAGAVVHDAR